MNHDKQSSLFSRLSDSITVIRGNAEIACSSERPKPINRYLGEIIKEIDRIDEVVAEMSKNCLSAECYSGPATSGALKPKYRQP